MSKNNHSSEWRLSTKLAKKNRRLTIMLLLSIILWIVTIIGVGVYIADAKSGNDHKGKSLCFCYDVGKVDVVYGNDSVP